jgi:DNA-binding MarR family transcriptional regulator
MSNITPSLKFFLNFGKAATVLSRRFDNRLSFVGLGFNDFMILYHLSIAPEEKMRRIDLAEAIGLTASGVTRMLGPMEKIGLIKREASEHDARVSFVSLAPGGKRLFNEALDFAEELTNDLVPENKQKKIEDFSVFVEELGKTKVY